MPGTTPSRTGGAPTRAAGAKKAAKPVAKKAVNPTKKASPAKAAAPKKAAATKKAAPKKAAPKKAAATKAAAPKKAAATKAVKAKPVAKKATSAATPVIAPAAPEVPRVEALPVAHHGGGSRRLLVGVGVALAVVVLGAVAAFALRDPAPSKASYIAKADEICTPGNGPVTAIVKPTSYPELSTASGTVVTATGAEVDQLTKLRRPGGQDGTQAEAALKAVSKYKSAASTLRDAAEKKDGMATIAATKSLKAAFADAKAKTKTFGFAACGSGMEPGIDTTVAGATGVIKTEFIAQAESFCRAAATKMEALPITPDTDAGLIADLNNALGVTQKLVADLKTLPAAPGDEEVVTDMLGAADKLNAKTVELRDAAQAGDFARVQAIVKEAGPINTDSNHRFDAYGLGACGSNFGA